MKKYFNITLAVVLILLGVLGYRANRPRPLTDCFPDGEWQEISYLCCYPQPGEDGGDWKRI